MPCRCGPSPRQHAKLLAVRGNRRDGRRLRLRAGSGGRAGGWLALAPLGSGRLCRRHCRATDLDHGARWRARALAVVFARNPPAVSPARSIGSRTTVARTGDRARARCRCPRRRASAGPSSLGSACAGDQCRSPANGDVRGWPMDVSPGRVYLPLSEGGPRPHRPPPPLPPLVWPTGGPYCRRCALRVRRVALIAAVTRNDLNVWRWPTRPSQRRAKGALLVSSNSRRCGLCPRTAAPCRRGDRSSRPCGVARPDADPSRAAAAMSGRYSIEATARVQSPFGGSAKRWKPPPSISSARASAWTERPLLIDPSAPAMSISRSAPIAQPASTVVETASLRRLPVWPRPRHRRDIARCAAAAGAALCQPAPGEGRGSGPALGVTFFWPAPAGPADRRPFERGWSPIGRTGTHDPYGRAPDLPRPATCRADGCPRPRRPCRISQRAARRGASRAVTSRGRLDLAARSVSRRQSRRRRPDGCQTGADLHADAAWAAKALALARLNRDAGAHRPCPLVAAKVPGRLARGGKTRDDRLQFASGHAGHDLLSEPVKQKDRDEVTSLPAMAALARRGLRLPRTPPSA